MVMMLLKLRPGNIRKDVRGQLQVVLVFDSVECRLEFLIIQPFLTTQESFSFRDLHLLYSGSTIYDECICLT